MEEKGESISFVNSKNEKIFEIPDGDAIKKMETDIMLFVEELMNAM